MTLGRDDLTAIAELLEAALQQPGFFDPRVEATERPDTEALLGRVRAAWQAVPAAVPAVPAYCTAYDTALTRWRETCRHPDDGRRVPVEPGCAACDTYSAACLTFLDTLTAQNTRDAADGYSYVSLTAECTRCGDNFMPNDENDLIHLVTEDSEGTGRYCGGRGTMLGGWR